MNVRIILSLILKTTIAITFMAQAAISQDTLESSESSQAVALNVASTLFFGLGQNHAYPHAPTEVDRVRLQSHEVPGSHGLLIPDVETWAVRFDSVFLQSTKLSEHSPYQIEKTEVPFAVTAYLSRSSGQLVRFSLRALRDTFPDFLRADEQNLLPLKRTSRSPSVGLQQALSGVCEQPLSAFSGIDAYILELDWPGQVEKPLMTPSDSLPFWYIILKRGDKCQYVEQDSIICNRTEVHYMVVEDSSRYSWHVIDVTGGW